MCPYQKKGEDNLKSLQEKKNRTKMVGEKKKKKK
jgi:hypothetical protein